MNQIIEKRIRFIDNYTEVDLVIKDERLHSIEILHFAKDPKITIVLTQPTLITGIRNCINGAYNFLVNEMNIKY